MIIFVKDEDLQKRYRNKIAYFYIYIYLSGVLVYRVHVLEADFGNSWLSASRIPASQGPGPNIRRARWSMRPLERGAVPKREINSHGWDSPSPKQQGFTCIPIGKKKESIHNKRPYTRGYVCKCNRFTSETCKLCEMADQNKARGPSRP